MRSFGLTIIFLFALLLQCKAQQAKAFTFQWKVNTESREDAAIFQRDNSKPFFLVGNSESVSLLSSPLQPIKYILSKGAIFCRMEDALYKHFNVWIKVRMGTDDRYSN